MQLGIGDYVRITLLQDYQNIGPEGAVLEGSIVDVDTKFDGRFTVHIIPVSELHPDAHIDFFVGDTIDKIQIEQLITVIRDPKKIPF